MSVTFHDCRKLHPNTVNNFFLGFGPPVQGSYVEKVLEGFSAASSSLKPNKVYPPPVVPRDYRPVHHFKMFDLMQSQPQTQGSQSSSKLDASARAVMLGEVGKYRGYV